MDSFMFQSPMLSCTLMDTMTCLYKPQHDNLLLFDLSYLHRLKPFDTEKGLRKIKWKERKVKLEREKQRKGKKEERKKVMH